MTRLKALLARRFGARDDTWPLIARLLRENLPKHKADYAKAFLCMALVAASTAASAWIMRDVIDEIFVAKNLTALWWVSGFVVAIFLVKGFASYGQAAILARVGNAVTADVQRSVYARTLRQGIGSFDGHSAGADLTMLLVRQANAARSAIEMVLVSFGRDLAMLVGLIGVMVAQHPRLSLLVLTIAPPIIIGVSRLVRRMKRLATDEIGMVAQVIALAQETGAGLRAVKAFGAESRMEARMDEAVDATRLQADRIARLQARTGPIMETLGGVAVALAILYGGWSVIMRGESSGGFFAFITALLMAYEPAKRLSRLHLQIESQMAGVRGLYEALDAPLSLADRPGAPALRVTAGRVEFEDVWFSYGEKPALQGLSFVAEPGETTALVGLSGGGKSTALTLIERFYDPDRGALRIDGQDLREVSQASVREALAYVAQDSFLFDASLRENIALGRPGASMAEIESAARAAHAHDFITAMPGGYESSAGVGGGALSGGQRQRIAIARAMLRDAPILLLDEATSALDAESESRIQQAMTRLMKGRTALVVAHRLSTIRSADRILVLDQGRLAESGRHAELLARGGLYARFHHLQFGEEAKRPTAAS
ncbi:ABC transporter ATP-binding protein [Neomegalonema sp.]|uniref:ABC transporter ATP-binding protein n=1 Tax=Neomegalonema sp. TaxID=2039713 RepID=UPI0026169890|nr:ABC transporter ATP-binding protein [Neomegalonema sp.]MDD2868103.1 ABC transporter ATP-binding protein [Neomegalonema sp.]